MSDRLQVILLRLIGMLIAFLEAILICMLINMCTSCSSKKTAIKEYKEETTSFVHEDSICIDSIIRSSIISFSHSYSDIEVEETLTEWSKPDSIGRIYPIKSSVRHEKVKGGQVITNREENATEAKYEAKNKVVGNKTTKKYKAKSKETFNSYYGIIPVVILVCASLFLMIKHHSRKL